MAGILGRKDGVDGKNLKGGWDKLLGVGEECRKKERVVRRLVRGSVGRGSVGKGGALRKLVDWKRYFDQRELYWRWKLDK